MIVRGAPLIGAAAAYGIALAMANDPSDANLERAYKVLLASRPTAVNLRWALDDQRALLLPLPPPTAWPSPWPPIRRTPTSRAPTRACWRRGRLP